MTLDRWTKLAEKQLKTLLARARRKPPIRRLGPARPWRIGVKFVGAPAMLKLNTKYRGKRYTTDILSFVVPEVFRREGYLGELVICLPVMKKQARELGHSAEVELEVLLAHGILHLLGLDHESGPKAEREMARAEASLLPRRRGLIHRTTNDR